MMLLNGTLPLSPNATFTSSQFALNHSLDAPSQVSVINGCPSFS